MIRVLLITCPLIVFSVWAFQYYSDNSKPLDLKNLVNEFENVPVKNAKYSLTVLTHLPVAQDASRVIDWLDGYPGHSFVQLTKICGKYCVTKTIGLYPFSPLIGLIYPGDMKGKFLDDALHKRDECYSIKVSKEEFDKLLQVILSKSGDVYYNMRSYNCTDFALEMLNTLRPGKPVLVHRDYLLNKAFLISTPGGLYRALQKQNNNDHAK